MNYRIDFKNHINWRSLSVFVFLLMLSNSVFCQTFSDFRNAKTINEKIRTADLISIYYSTNDIDTLKLIGYELLVASNKKNHARGINFARLYAGMYYIRAGETDDGLRLLRLSKNYFMELEDFSMATIIAAEIGIGYQISGNLREAMNWYQQSLRYADITEEEKMKHLALLNIANVYVEKKEYSSAKTAAIIYKDWALKNNMINSTTNAYAVLGTIYLQEGAYSDAIEYFELSDLFAQKSKSIAAHAHAINNIAIAKFIQGNSEESLVLFKEALELRKKVKNVRYICEAYLNVGGIYFEQGKYKQATREYEIGYKLAKEKQLLKNEQDFIAALIEVNEKLGYSTVELKKEENELENRMEVTKNEPSKSDKLLREELNYNPVGGSKVQEEDHRVLLYFGGGIILIIFLILIAVKYKFNK